MTKSERPAPPFPKSSDDGIIDEEDAQDINYDHDNDPDSGHDNGHDNCHDNDHYFSDHLCIKMSKYDFQHKVKISDQKSMITINGLRNKFLKIVMSVHYIEQ